MNLLKLLSGNKYKAPNAEKSANNYNSSDNLLTVGEENSIFKVGANLDNSYLLNAWVNIAVNILIRNIARADFTIKNDGEDLKHGPIFELFHKPNTNLSRYDLWKETAGWWYLEGEAFWWFGPDYAGGFPKEIYILDPRNMRNEGEAMGGISFAHNSKPHRWF
jgi:hypothetical protein